MERAATPKKVERYAGQGAIVGIVERSLYYAALVATVPLFIGIWLTLKTVSRSPRWGTDTGNIPGRAIFQPFLVGTGLSLLYAGGGYETTMLLLKKNSESEALLWAVLSALFVVWLLSFACAWWALWKLKKKKKKIKDNIGIFPNL